MILKTSLHIHTKEDKSDGHAIDYNIYELIDEAAKLNFKVLAITPHRHYIFKKKHFFYAKQKGILLIRGIELSLGRIRQNHVLVLNCNKSIEKVCSLKDLEKYKKKNPKIFIIAPHPTYNRLVSIGVKNLKKYIKLFDAIEHSWFYYGKNKKNKKAEKIAKYYNKPMIATGDVHVLKNLNSDYALINAKNFSIPSVFEAIKNKNFSNITYPKKIRKLLKYVIKFETKYLYRKFIKKLKIKKNPKFILPSPLPLHK